MSEMEDVLMEELPKMWGAVCPGRSDAWINGTVVRVYAETLDDLGVLPREVGPARKHVCRRGGVLRASKYNKEISALEFPSAAEFASVAISLRPVAKIVPIDEPRPVRGDGRFTMRDGESVSQWRSRLRSVLGIRADGSPVDGRGRGGSISDVLGESSGAARASGIDERAQETKE